VLTHLHITSFALVDQLDLELHKGLTTVTGETGAGKSIMLDALGLALGDRTDADKVRTGSKKAEIHASFDLSDNDYARRWLRENELTDGDDCILRRVITAEGRSRAYINGQTATLGQLRTFGEILINIHSQHEHQSLLHARTHQRLLDAFGGLTPLAKQVKEAYQHWHTLDSQLQDLQNQSEELNARFQLLSYQVDELDQLDIQPGELQQLETEQRTRANAETINQHSAQVIALCSGDEGIQDRLNHTLHLLSQLKEKPSQLQEAENLLQNALIHVQEAQSELDHFVDSQDQDEQRLIEVEQRLSIIYEIARKHRINAEELEPLHQNLIAELRGLQSGDEQLEALETERERALNAYQQLATELSDQRQFASARLAKAVNEKLAQLAMNHAQLSIALHPQSTPGAQGNETTEFLICTNPGQPPRPLIKIASGGELSRVSLAIQVVTAQTSTTPTLIFDEVDVGIGGTTGDEVGNMLRELGKNAQVLCVTHLAQVASKAHQHLQVSKECADKSTTTRVKTLNKKEKIAELARMMGGDIDSRNSLAHAREMLATA